MRRLAEVPSPATQHIVDRNRCGLLKTSDVVLHQLFAQTCKRQPTYLLTRSRGDSAGSRWIAFFSPDVCRCSASTLTDLMQDPQVITEIPVEPNPAPITGFDNQLEIGGI